ncbi:MAG: glycosyltransferase [Candidatus Cloacimonetes bacterium]|nr:glycosyltransferase [Candidatus Cloacimonadota bacterium]
MQKRKKIPKRIISLLGICILLISLLRIVILNKQTNFDSENIKNINVLKAVVQDKGFSFIVLGSIENSQLLFQKANIRKINSDASAFIISNGNAVVDGAEFKYITLWNNLKKINKPVISCFGKNESSFEGDERFYHHFGAYYFSFQLQDSYFIFLDVTGKTPLYLQQDWLQTELELSSKCSNRFVFMQRSPVIFEQLKDIYNEGYYVKDEQFREYLINIYQKYQVTAVFSAAAPIYSHQVIGEVNYFNSGCAGGALLVDNADSYNHYLKVYLGTTVNYETVHIIKGEKSLLQKVAYNILYYLNSFFYLSFVDFVLIFSLVFIMLLLIYRILSKPVNYYRDFDSQVKPAAPEKLKIAMFSNNYLPFIGGVPISIQRLAQGLQKQGHQVYIFAPQYRNCAIEDNQDDLKIVRLKPLMYYKKRNFIIPVPNIYSTKMKKEFLALMPDVVHLHHPYWMGKIGLKWARKYKIPTVFTYHTRFELYAHNIPVFPELFAGKIPHKIIKRFANKCNAIIAPTSTAKEYLRNLGVGKIIKVIPTGIELSRYEVSEADRQPLKEIFKKEDDIILLSVSRLSMEKNLNFLLEGLKYIDENTGIPFKCLIAGSGSEKDNLQKTINQNGMEEKVILLGAVPPEEITRYFQLADIFIFASRSETQGMVLLEAMAGKTPVVAVRSSGIDDVIEDGYNGFKTDEDIHQWSEKIISLMENNSLLYELSENAFIYARSFSTELISKRVLELYNALSNYANSEL